MYCAVYRNGGRDNFVWHRTFAMSHADAMKSVEEIEKVGRAAYLVDYNQSVALGLPETYSAKDRYFLLDEEGEGNER